MKYKYFLTVFVAFGIFFSPFLMSHTEALNNDTIFLEREVEVFELVNKSNYEQIENEVNFSLENKIIDSKNNVVSVFIDPKSNSINAVSVKIKYSKESLKPIIIDSTNSDFSLFFVEDINETEGIITITYIEPYPGISYKALVADILFEKIDEKESGISVESDSEVLANDGFGTHLAWISEKLIIK